MIYSYQKHISTMHTLEAHLPENESGQRIGAELATIDGTTYIGLPDGVDLPAQPDGITVVAVELTGELLDKLKQASPHYQLIDQQVVERIRQRYSAEDEIKLLRIAPSDETAAWNDYVEECLVWGRGKKAGIGL